MRNWKSTIDARVLSDRIRNKRRWLVAIYHLEDAKQREKKIAPLLEAFAR